MDPVRALAIMESEQVIQVLDAGTTPDGLKSLSPHHRRVWWELQDILRE